MAKLFDKILIANRGECAVRIIKACKELKIPTVAVYSQADAKSPHVKLANEAICIGPPQTDRSYLYPFTILSAAEITGADAIHPGYGFLAENTLFARMCRDCKVVFIGPSIETMEQINNKVQVKQTMAFAGVPVIPGSDEEVKNERQAIEIARKIGYPVVLKAAAGGGGRGIKVVNNDKELKDRFLLTQSEAKSSFGDPKVYIEKYFFKARHIEFQILADHNGNIIHLGERDCSLQRRHQKLIEEAPAQITKKQRKEMGEVALAAAKAVFLNNAGTIEFLLIEDGDFYFIEINGRLQVEHPITEMITGVDLVKEQIRLAAGEELGYDQSDIKFSGHAIEFRIYAEDPEKKFSPISGKITHFFPPEDPYIRIDSHLDSKLEVGYEIPPFYDSLLAKLIIWGKNRRKAISKSKKALEKFTIAGINSQGGSIKTTIPFYKKFIEESVFKKGKVYTDFLSENRVKSI